MEWRMERARKIKKLAELTFRYAEGPAIIALYTYVQESLINVGRESKAGNTK